MISREATIGIAVASVAFAGVAAYGVVNRDRAQELAKSLSESLSAGASAAASKSSEAFKAVQTSASSSYTTVASSFNKGLTSLKGYVTPRRYRRVKSFPLVVTEEDLIPDVAVGKKQQRLKDKPAKGSPKKASAQAKGAAITVQVTAK